MSDAAGREDAAQTQEQPEQTPHRHVVIIGAGPGEGSANGQESGVRDATSTTAGLARGAGHKIRPDLREEEVVKGSLPGDRFIRQSRQAGVFRRKGGGVLSASLDTDRPRSRWG